MKRTFITRLVPLMLAVGIVGHLGCSRKSTQVAVATPEEEPRVAVETIGAPPEDPSIRWTMQRVSLKEDVGHSDGKDHPVANPGGPSPGKSPRMPEEAAERAGQPAEALKDKDGPPRRRGDFKEEKLLRQLREEPVEDVLRSKVEGRGEGKGEPKGEGKRTSDLAKDGKKPQVWKRDAQRPTFARVYVGDGNSLEMVSLNVTVTVDGPRARTVVDHVFRNPHDRRLEGTFEYPLPSGASPSYFAMFLGDTRATMPPMFVRRGNQPPLAAAALALMAPTDMVASIDTQDWGKLREARVVPKQKALEVYEDVVRSQIDPALLEYAGGNTFSGRVFPIAPKGFNRVILAYEELLPVSSGQAAYRFPLPDCKLGELKFTLQANAADCKEAAFKPDAKKQEADGRITFTKAWNDKGPGGDALFTFAPPQARVQAISGRHGKDGPVYVYARVRPELKVQEDRPFAEQAVFLLDTSLSEHPDRFAVNAKLLRKILEADASIKQFNVLTFNVASAWVEPAGWLPNDPAGREKALATLDGLVLEGATDLSSALTALSKPTFAVAPGTPLNVFLLSDGQITWGEPDVSTLVARFESHGPFPTRFHCYRTGLGAENQALYEALVRKGGGVFNCLTEADVPAAARAHRSQCFQVSSVRFVGGPAAHEVLVAGRKAAVYPGGDLVVAAKLDAPGRTQVVVEGTFLGKTYHEEYPIEVTGASVLAPRGWGEIAVAALQALNDPNLENLTTAYCQQFGIGNALASFLVLENDADYKRFNLEDERGRTVPGGDVAKVVEAAWKNVGQVLPPRQAVERFLARIEPRVKLLGGAHGAHVKKLLDLLADADFEVPAGELAGTLLYTKDVPAEYLKAREADRRKVETYLTEVERRGKKDPTGVLRALSCIVEEHPGRADAQRLVGYRLLDVGMPSHSVRLFQQVQQNRPFEPHSYRDLARSLEDSGKYGLAALQYEIVLAGAWHSRFREELKLVAQEEYARMMQDAIRRKAVSKALADHFGDRLEKLAVPSPRSDLRVTISWNTDATDVDLWVIEPDGTRCFYQHNKTKNGGQLSDDQTQGYGPERYQIAKAQPGEFIVVVHYFSANNTLLGGETHVNVVVAKNAGTPQEVVQRRTVVLKQQKEQLEVCRIKF